MPPACRCRPLAATRCAAPLLLLAAAVAAWSASRPATAWAQRDLLVNAPFVDDADDADDAKEITPEKAVRFTLRGVDLQVSTDVELKPVRQTLKLTGLDGTASIEIARRGRGMGGPGPAFELQYTSAARGEPMRQESVTVTTWGTRVDINRTTTVGDLYTMVSLRQESVVTRRNRMLEARGGDRISFRVRTSRLRSPQAADDVSLRVGSFAELLSKYPGLTARHLAPLFREFNQDADIFRVDARMAWQLFPEAFHTDAATESKVAEIVERLDDADFRRREVATAELDVLGGSALLALAKLERGPLSPEQNARIDAVLSRYNRLDPDEVEALRGDTDFLVRCFIYGEDEAIRAAAVQALGQRLGADAVRRLDPAAKPAARAGAGDTLLAATTQPSPAAQ